MVQHPQFDHLYFFGRFNFPHIGYLYVIREALKQLSPTQGIQIIFSAEQTTWEKKAISLEHRVAMFALACEELPVHLRSQVHFSSIEYDLQKKLGSSYGGFTIDTLQELQTRHPKRSAAIVMGADAALGISGHHQGITAWKDWQGILNHSNICIVPRGRYPDAATVQSHLQKELLPYWQKKKILILSTTPTTEQLHASSSSVEAGHSEFLPQLVKEYAFAKQLLIQ